jgi:hypothetical protein
MMLLFWRLSKTAYTNGIGGGGVVIVVVGGCGSGSIVAAAATAPVDDPIPPPRGSDSSTGIRIAAHESIAGAGTHFGLFIV